MHQVARISLSVLVVLAFDSLKGVEGDLIGNVLGTVGQTVGDLVGGVVSVAEKPLNPVQPPKEETCPPTELKVEYEDEDEEERTTTAQEPPSEEVERLADALGLEKPLSDAQKELLERILRNKPLSNDELEGLLQLLDVCSILEAPLSVVAPLSHYISIEDVLKAEKYITKPPKC